MYYVQIYIYINTCTSLYAWRTRSNSTAGNLQIYPAAKKNRSTLESSNHMSLSNQGGTSHPIAATGKPGVHHGAPLLARAGCHQGLDHGRHGLCLDHSCHHYIHIYIHTYVTCIYSIYICKLSISCWSWYVVLQVTDMLLIRQVIWVNQSSKWLWQEPNDESIGLPCKGCTTLLSSWLTSGFCLSTRRLSSQESQTNHGCKSKHLWNW